MQPISDQRRLWPSAPPPPTPPAAPPPPGRLPPRNGPLPHTAEDYLALPESQRKPYLDFMILGQLPAGKSLRRRLELQQICIECLRHQELGALDDLLHRVEVPRLRCNLGDITHETGPRLLEVLQRHPETAELSLFGTGQQARDVAPLCALLAAQQSVKAVGLYEFTPPESAAVMHALAGSAGIEQVMLVYSAFDERCAAALCRLFQRSPAMSRLHLCSTALEESSMAPLMQAMAATPTPKTLSLSMSTLTPGAATTLARALEKNVPIRDLNLALSGLCAPSFHAIAAALYHNVSLERLSLNENAPDDASLIALAAALDHNRTLTHLTLCTIGKQPVTPSLEAAVTQRIARNQALASGVLARDYADVFSALPDGAPAQLVDGPDQLLVQALLAQSPSIDAFHGLMHEIMLATSPQRAAAPRTRPDH